jgi:flagellar protein FlaG
MSSSINVNPSGAPGDAGYGGGHSQSSPDGARSATPPAERTADGEPDPADLRLVIEDDEIAGSYIYKTIDRRTGKVVQQYPREQILKLRDAADYTAGAVIKAKV